MVISSFVDTRNLDTHQEVLFVIREQNKEYLPLPALSFPPSHFSGEVIRGGYISVSFPEHSVTFLWVSKHTRAPHPAWALCSDPQDSNWKQRNQRTRSQHSSLRIWAGALSSFSLHHCPTWSPCSSLDNRILEGRNARSNS